MSAGGVWIQAQCSGNQWREAVHVWQRGLRSTRSRQYVQQEAARASVCAGGGGGGAGSVRTEPHGVRGRQRLGSLGLRGRWLRQTGTRSHHHQGYSAGKLLSFVILLKESWTLLSNVCSCFWAGFEIRKKGPAWCTQEERYAKSRSLTQLKSDNVNIGSLIMLILVSFGSIVNTYCSCTSLSRSFIRKTVQLKFWIFSNYGIK